MSRGAEQNELAMEMKFSEAERGLRAAFQALRAKGTALQEHLGTPLSYGGEAGCTPARPFGAQTNNLTLLFFNHHNWGRILDPTTRQHICRAQGQPPKPPSPGGAAGGPPAAPRHGGCSLPPCVRLSPALPPPPGGHRGL